MTLLGLVRRSDGMRCIRGGSDRGRRDLADHTVEAELGPVIGEDGIEVVEPGLGQRLDGLEHLYRARGHREAGPLGSPTFNTGPTTTLI
jgi:hypothetical protein